jgi:hypothetical protein
MNGDCKGAGMDKLDGRLLANMKQWRCKRNKNHMLGAIERVEVKLQANGSTLKYHTSRLSIFREAIDQAAEVPAEIDVAGTLDGKMLSMVWRCSVPGCGCINEWHPDGAVIEILARTYIAE